MSSNTITVQDVLRFVGKKKVNKKIDTDLILPFIIVPILLLISSISRTITLIVIVALGMTVLYVYSRPRQKERSQFFYSWTLSSCIYMFLIFEFEILMFLEITQLENLVLIVLMFCTCFSFYKVRSIADNEFATGSSKGKEYSPVITSESHYCYICEIEVNERYFHSLWWDCCIFRPNYPYFFTGLLFSFFTFVYGADLGLTTVCRPYVFYGPILLPEDCSDVYFEFDTAISFVACVYALGYAFVIGLLLLQQFCIYLPKYCDKQCSRLVSVLNV